MAVAVDAVGSTNSDIVIGGASSFSGTPITATASATAVTSSICFSAANGTTQPTGVVIKWAAQTLSIVSGADSGFVSGGSFNTGRSIIYAIGSPTTGAQTFSGTWTNNYDGYANIMSWKGSDTSTPCKNGTSATNTNANPSISVTSPAGDFAVGCMTNDNQTPGPIGQTEWWIDTSGAAGNGAANYTTGAGSTTLSMTASANTWVYAACDVQVPTGAVDTLMAQACL